MALTRRKPRKFQKLQKRRTQQIARSRRKLHHLDLLKKRRRHKLDLAQQGRKTRHTHSSLQQQLGQAARRRMRLFKLKGLKSVK